ncbi:MAG TPA: SgcJ/EcaC family oxidoreductase [Thermoanaerobaculia bacterium]|nr:SgcJ/EcaC family oxidoreductase [Thermoanaerobaculia bacterium]
MSNQRSFRSASWLIAAVLFLAACTCQAAAPQAVPAATNAARRDVESAMQQYTTLLRTGPVDAQVALFTQDGELLEPGMAPLHGRDAIKAFLAPIAAKYEVQSAASTSDSVEVFGDAAYQWGTYTQQAGERGKPGADYTGRYVASWRREADGHWRISRFLVQPFPSGVH